MIPFNPKTMPAPRCRYCASPMRNIVGAPEQTPTVFYGQCPRCDGIVSSLPIDEEFIPPGNKPLPPTQRRD